MAESASRSRSRRATGVQNDIAPRMGDRGLDGEVAGRLHESVRVAGGNKAVAGRSGVPLATVNNYVRGRNGMKIGPLAALAAACNVSLEWLVSGGRGSPPPPDYPVATAVPPPGLGEAPAESSPAGMTCGVDLNILAKAIEVVAAIAGAADFQDDPKGLARRIATTYAVLVQPETPRD